MFYAFPINRMRTTYPGRLIHLISQPYYYVVMNKNYEVPTYENSSSILLISPFMIKYYVSGYYPSSWFYLKDGPVYM
jgi:hypothetical protein